MNEQGLNRNLAEWAGFIYHSYEVFEYEYKHTRVEDPYWENPGGRRCREYPDFTKSLDICFRWLVPKIEDIIYEIRIILPVEGVFGWGVYIVTIGSAPNWEVGGEAENPALALCLAIEKLIDSQSLSCHAKHDGFG